MAQVKISNFSQNWSGSSVEYNGIKMNVADVASSGSSKLIDLQLNSGSKFSVDKDGNVSASNFIGTSSYASNALSSSYSQTSSYAENAGGGVTINNNTSSYLLIATGNEGEISASKNLTFDGTKLILSGSHAEGSSTVVVGQYSHAEGDSSIASGSYSHAEGYLTIASSSYSHAEGNEAWAVGQYSHAEGIYTTANGDNSHAEGSSTITEGQYSHAEGDSTTAVGDGSHSEGQNTVASGSYSHAEGDSSVASGQYSHAEGYLTIAPGYTSHAEGRQTIASGSYSHAEGFGTIAKADYQNVSGKYNVTSSNSNDLFIIGNGISTNNRSNIFLVNTSSVVVGGTLSSSRLYIDPTISGIETSGIGELNWNSVDQTANLGLNGEVTLQIGLEQLMRVKATEDIRNGMAVYAAGQVGGSDNIEVKKFNSNSEFVDELYFIGIATQDLSNNEEGFVTTFGKVRGINGDTYTSGGIRDDNDVDAWSVGDILYPSPNISGSLTSIVPTSPDRQMSIAMVLKIASPTNLTIFVRSEHGYHLGELHNVIESNNQSGDLLTYNSSSKVWINSKNLTGSYNLTGSLTSIQGGFTGSLYGTSSYASSALSSSYASNGVNISNNTNNNILTATGTGGQINGESGLTFDGVTLTISGSSPQGSRLKHGYDTYVKGDFGPSLYSAHAEGIITSASGFASHAEGYGTIAQGNYSHAEGNLTTALSEYTHAEGHLTYVLGENSHAEGYRCRTNSNYSHAEGYTTTASAIASHAEGFFSITNGNYSHAEGSGSITYGIASHAEGNNTVASASYQHVGGHYNSPSSNQNDLFIIGNGTSVGSRSNIIVVNTSSLIVNGTISSSAGITSSGFYGTSSYASNALSSSYASNGVNISNNTNNNILTATGTGGQINGESGLTFDGLTLTISGSSPQGSRLKHGLNTYVKGDFLGFGTLYSAHAEGINTSASGYGSHAEGFSTTALKDSSHVEGAYCVVNADYSHAEGYQTYINGASSHTEGYRTSASAIASHAEGFSTETYGDYSHAEGSLTKTYGDYSHAEGNNTVASASYQHVGGHYNSPSSNQNDLFIIGNGTSVGSRSNIIVVNTSSLIVNGTISSSAGITSSGFYGTSSYAVTASYVLGGSPSVSSSYVSGSVSVIETLYIGSDSDSNNSTQLTKNLLSASGSYVISTLGSDSGPSGDITIKPGGGSSSGTSGKIFIETQSDENGNSADITIKTAGVSSSPGSIILYPGQISSGPEHAPVLPGSGSSIDFGSGSIRWGVGYFETINANSINNNGQVFKSVNLGLASGSVDIDLSTGNYFYGILNGNITDLNVTNIPSIGGFEIDLIQSSSFTYVDGLTVKTSSALDLGVSESIFRVAYWTNNSGTVWQRYQAGGAALS